jgi:beta-lactamase regulating signal transducer with metallopeptidase domain
MNQPIENPELRRALTVWLVGVVGGSLLIVFVQLLFPALRQALTPAQAAAVARTWAAHPAMVLAGVLGGAALVSSPLVLALVWVARLLRPRDGNAEAPTDR